MFNAPVIESYGTTEVSMVTCNPLPPRPRKTGSVGLAVGAELAIMDELGNLLPAGATGEVVVRGASVMQGSDNATANRDTFTPGWFRTGDQGYMDVEGYLFITGRIQEVINRGGEKIAPQEVDNVLLDHPAVAQAVTFAMPHARLGEEVAAAVVLHPHAVAAEDLPQREACLGADKLERNDDVVAMSQPERGETQVQENRADADDADQRRAEAKRSDRHPFDDGPQNERRIARVFEHVAEPYDADNGQ